VTLMPTRFRRRPPMGCSELVELVTAYVEGTLDTPDRQRFEAHLALCEGCNHYVEQLRTTIRLTGRLNHDELPDHMRERLLHAFREWTQA
jgi:anti-sigma factor RsiW